MELTETEKGYLAGLIDGEGCIFIARWQDKRRTSPSHSLVLVVTQANGPFLRYWQNKTGMGKIYPQKRAAGENGQRPPVFQWRLNASAARDLLSLIMPYLVLKRGEAQIALQFQATQLKRGGYGSGGVPRKVIQEREDLKQLLSRGRSAAALRNHRAVDRLLAVKVSPRWLQKKAETLAG